MHSPMTVTQIHGMNNILFVTLIKDATGADEHWMKISAGAPNAIDGSLFGRSDTRLSQELLYVALRFCAPSLSCYLGVALGYSRSTKTVTSRSPILETKASCAQASPAVAAGGKIFFAVMPIQEETVQVLRRL